MSQFKMNAEISLKANNAIKAIQKFNKETSESKKEFSILGRTIALDTKRMGKNLAAMGIIAGGLFAGILTQSPHLRTEFKKLGASTLLFNVALGEKLQPTVAFLVDIMILLQEKFLALPDDIQEVIVVTGFLTLALTAATLAAIGLWVALGPITLAIGGIALALALLYIAWNSDWDGIASTGDWFADHFGGTIDIISDVIDNLITILGTLAGAFMAVFGPMMIIAINAFKLALDAVILVLDIILGAIDLILAAIISLVTWDMTPLEDAWKRFTNAIGDDLRSILDSFTNLLYSIYNTVVDAINAISPGNPAGGHLGGGDSPNTAGQTTEDYGYGHGIGRAEGGDIYQDGLIFAHRDERITTKSEARGNRRGGSTNGGMTINNYNTFKIASVDSKKRVREMLKEAERINKRNNDRRFKV